MLTQDEKCGNGEAGRVLVFPEKLANWRWKATQAPPDDAYLSSIEKLR
jgi:hypothetical protein